MAEMTLEQLKAENAKAEAEASADPQKALDKDTDGAADDGLDTSTGADSGTDGGEPPEVEPWMQSDEDEAGTGGHEPEKEFTHRDIAAAKRKLKARLSDSKQREQELEKENAELKQKLESGQQRQLSQPAIGAKPKADDYETEAEFTSALVKWEMAAHKAELNADVERQKQKSQAAAYERQVADSVDAHYERAAELAAKSKIAPDAYQAADYNVRQMADEVYPGAGDVIIDNIIATLGEGSEKVIFNLGINTKRRQQVKELLEADRSGMRAIAHLGGLKAQLNLAGKRRKEPPPPAGDVTGDSKTGESYRVLKRKYAEAHKRGDTQTAFNLRRQARQQGANVTDW